MIGSRYIVAAGLAFLVTFGLFYLMQVLISTTGTLDKSARNRAVDFIRLKREPELELKKRKLPNKKPPDEPPPPPQLELSSAPNLGPSVGGFGLNLDLGLEMAGGIDLGASASDTDAVPIVRVNPQYPMRAAERRIAGWVELMFTITTAGTVKDPVVTASYPGSIFDREALRAIRKWKYNPKIVDGQPVERPGIEVRLRFELSDE